MSRSLPRCVDHALNDRATKRPGMSTPNPRRTAAESEFPFLSWGRMAGLGVLASVLVYLADGTTRDPGESGPQPARKARNWIESVAFNPGRPLAGLGGRRPLGVALGHEPARAGP